jgi:WD40 repeat protein
MSSDLRLQFPPGNYCIRAVDLESGQVFLLAGTPELDRESDFYKPKGVAVKPSSVDNNYDIYVTYTHSNPDNPDDSGISPRIRRISVSKDGIRQDWSNSNVSYIDLASPGYSCEISGLGLTPDGGSLIVSCSEGNTIHRYDINTQAWILIAGSTEKGYLNAFANAARFRFPRGIAVSPDGKWALIAE